MNSLEFCERYFRDGWCERDLQMLVQRQLRQRGMVLAPSGGDKGARKLAGSGLERLTPVDKMAAYCEQK